MRHTGTFSLGDAVGAYQVQTLIGVGFMGEVYRAVHLGTGEVVALKCLQVRHTDNPDLVERARREAVALTQIRHANIVHVHEAGVTDSGVVWMAMELLDGRSLRLVMKEQGRMPVPTALHFACEIADGVDAAHEFSIVHRDLKPENVFVTHRDELRVLDLGTAKFFGQDMETTGRAQVFGTVPYMSPEHLAGERVDARTDVYALGMMLYEMLAGAHPFKAHFESVIELGRAQMFQMPKPLFEVLDGLPGYVWPVIEKAVMKDREHRYMSMSEFARTLRRMRKRFVEERMRTDEYSALERTLPRIPSTRRDYVPPQPPPRLSDPGRPKPSATAPGPSGYANGVPPGGFLPVGKTLRIELNDDRSRISSLPAEPSASSSRASFPDRIGPFGTQVIPADLRAAMVAQASAESAGRASRPTPARLPLPMAAPLPRAPHSSAPWRSNEPPPHTTAEVRTDDGVGIPMRAALDLPRQRRYFALFISLCAALAIGFVALMWVRYQRAASAQSAAVEGSSDAPAAAPMAPFEKQEAPVLEPANVSAAEVATADAPAAAPVPEVPAASPPTHAEEALAKPMPTTASSVSSVPSGAPAQGSGGKLTKKPTSKPTAAPRPPKVAPLFDF